MKDKHKSDHKRKRVRIVLFAVLISFASIFCFLELGVVYTANTWEHFSPKYEKTDVTAVLAKEELSEEDYYLLYRQTGLTQIAIDELRAKNLYGKILEIQDFFFSDYKIRKNHFNVFTYQEELQNAYAPMTLVQDGDIVVTGTTRVSWLRYGHAALVIDGQNRTILESVGVGTKSEINPIECLSMMANFIILRPKVAAEIKNEVVSFAKDNLVGVPYRLTVGLFFKKYNATKIEKTQCAHLVWYVYKKYGIDLDSNGGWLVKPQDIANSPHVEVVQVFGFDLDRLWSL